MHLATKETMLYSHIQGRGHVDKELFTRSPKQTDCRCKYFIGPYKKLKGLTVKVVIYVSVQGKSQGHNRKAAYTAISRSSCIIIMLNITVISMTMKSYQAEKVTFYRKKFHDQGWGRKNDFSLLGNPMKPTKHDTFKKNNQVCYMSREGNLKELTNENSVPSALGNGQLCSTTSRTTGIMSDLCRVPKGVEEEWLDGGLLPASQCLLPALEGTALCPWLEQLHCAHQP